MSPLNHDQKELIFDFSFGLTSQEQTAEAKKLISMNQEAAEIYARLKAALSPLESVEPQICPDDLVERTIAYVSEHADSSQYQLEQLLAVEQTKPETVKIGFWHNMTEMAAIAASILLIVGVLVPTMSFARQKYWQSKCGAQLSGFFQGLSNYMADYDGRHPAVATTAGASWWKIGDQGQENQSNTRKVYLLVLGNYVRPGIFICPGNKAGKKLQIDPTKIQSYKDFPGRRYVTYSFQISCNQTSGGTLLCRRAVMADLNPLFEKLPNYDSPFRVRLDRRLLTVNSSNHNSRGQNVLFGDGRVEFLKTRYIGISHDDIFTLQNTDIYQGYEMPTCITDFFLAP